MSGAFDGMLALSWSGSHVEDYPVMHSSGGAAVEHSRSAACQQVERGDGAMPLSEDEQKLLDALEAQLHADDPKLAKSFSSAGSPVRDRRRIGLGVLGVVVGLVLLVVSVAANLIWLGILAFALMAVAGVWAATAPARPQGGNGSGGSGGSRPNGSAGSPNSPFMQRMEDRWERRSDSDGMR